jgi:hypothetical protein
MVGISGGERERARKGVGAAAGRLRHHEMNEARGIILRSRGRRMCGDHTITTKTMNGHASPRSQIGFFD